MESINALFTSILIAILFCTAGFSQNSVPKFPEDWMGSYEGTMYFFHSNGNPADTIGIQFTLAPTEKANAWRYVMSYESEKYGNSIKDYLIIQPDTLPANTYLTDEKNGIYIEEVLLGNTFYSSFSVGKSRLFSTLRKRGETIEWEITTTRDGTSLESGTKPDKDGNVFLVDSHIPVSTQKAILYPVGQKR